MRLSEMNTKLRAIKRVRGYKWPAAVLLGIAITGAAYLIVFGDHMAAWLAAATGPIGVVMGLEWWRDAFMRYLEFAGALGFGVLAGWGAVRSGHPELAVRLFTAAGFSGAFMLYSTRGQ